ncbi:MAG: glycosyltransferase family 1 protein [Zymomonas mobilis subsp. pomaceae]|uniref:Glycosyl transferase group 1 n=1 Tax=Zymomonas mobilis subsp. pomaceae (strain ATCC 29192 / DSM 22645 / JCM 10191 / CCUG 17912 / NBRC 13757 / NCIMB 11200 / NRRL B-4491 / Barker I) TaxID=579138 RepID=F8ETY7_ZYMMT|nr:glycosyltransferase family 1 protein [Zymomonas mobilis]AEI38084.1 glycosyl transferase group 1 [Zymomonas mobilis subsp. pomaceae ATCC 29192]MDX5949450.1 glycosyltransferase family 1 protein [Zymomonas mobilis subsp. pomaceae]GEB89193.1 glycosyl hydrolase [Zymomonas mobilis subsp. pomaceae]
MDIRNLRLALFTGNYNYVRDGANQALNRLVRYLMQQGASVRIYSPRSETPAFPAVGKVIAVPAIPFPGRSEYCIPIALTSRVRRDIKDFAPNIIHIASPEYLGHRAVSLARKWNLPAVASVHTRFETYPRYYGMPFLEPVIEAILRRLYRRCDAIFAPSESMAQVLRDQRMSYDVRIWSRGVDRQLFSPKARDMNFRRDFGINDHEVVIGFVGRLVMEKGLDVFSDTIDELIRRQIAHRVMIIGDGPARGWFERRLPQAIFAGFHTGKALARAVASTDLLFNPSVTETFGNVTLEAMATGRPVVAAQATGSESLIEDPLMGRLIRPGAIKDFADALQDYCENKNLREETGYRGYEMSDRYGWDNVNQVLADSYLSIIQARMQSGYPPRLRPRS